MSGNGDQEEAIDPGNYHRLQVERGQKSVRQRVRKRRNRSTCVAARGRTRRMAKAKPQTSVKIACTITRVTRAD
jgi:hypothetical protein